MEVKEYETLLKQAYRTAPIGLCFIDSDFRCLHINEWLASINGLSVEEHLGRTISEVIPDVSAGGVMSQLHRVMETGESVHDSIIETETPASPHRKRIFQTSFHAVKSDEGITMGVSCIVQDITDRKRTEEALRESEDRNLILSEASFEGLLIHDRGKVIDANTRLQKMFGYSLEELMKMTDYELIAPKVREEVLQNVAEGNEGSYETVGLRKDSTTFPMELQARNMQYRGRRVSAVACQDITNRKRAERLQSDQRRVLELISLHKASLTEILETITRVAEAHLPDVRSTILLLDNNTLRHGAAPSMPDAYNALIDGLPIGPAVGSCGTAAYRKERVVVEDVRSDPLWAEYRSLGEDYGFRACWSQPIVDLDENVLGTFALYSALPGKPTDKEILFIESMAHLAGIALERNRAEEALIARAETERLLRRELDHRVRNNLASLISLIDLSRSGGDSVEAFAESIKGRAQIIASVHSALSRTKWHAIELRSLLETLMDTGDDGHIKLDGPAVIIPPEQAQAVGLIAHELATNSRKHGALSCPNGSVEVSWKEQLNESGARQVILRWLETGGPPIETELKPGTGMRLISGLVNYELHGQVNFRFPSHGADHTIAIPLTEGSTAQIEVMADDTRADVLSFKGYSHTTPDR